MKGLLLRFFTSIFFASVMLGGLFGGPYSFVLLFALITGLCLWEFYGLVLSRNSRRDIGRMVLGLMTGLYPFTVCSLFQLRLVSHPEKFLVIAALLFFPVVFMAFIYELYTHSARPFNNVGYLLLGMIYIGVPFAMLNFIAFDGQGFHSGKVFGLLALTWTNDSWAYLVGSRIGRTPLFPRISPKKTWEGAAGGLVAALIIALVINLLVHGMHLSDWLILALIVVVFGSFGDLVESMLKRSLDVKDSGNLLPGHGGMLDRFDAFIFLLPFATAYLLWVR